ncbi:MAG: phosphatase PAP2 family protein [Bacilli bacterium]|nr:phosphatase PAP2 family protein [Bacilli bacterium]
MKKAYNFIRNNWKPIIFSMSILIFVFMVRLLLADQVHYFDEFVYKYVTYFKNDYLTTFFKIMSFLASTTFLLFVTVFIMVFIKKKNVGFYVGLNILLCFLLNQSVKLVFGRSRPEFINLIEEGGYSFPSGHSMVSLAFYGFFIYMIFHKRYSKKKKVLLSIPFALLTLLIGISRIYLGVHYASDVLAGFALSMAYLIIYVKLFYKKIK